MSQIKIYGTLNSRASRVVWLAEEMGLDYRHIPVIQASRLSDPQAPDAQLNTLSDAFRQVSPHGVVPVLDDHGTVLTESLSILLHLATTRTVPVCAATDAESAQMAEWFFWAATLIEPDGVAVIVNKVIRDAATANHGSCTRAEARLRQNLVRLDRALSGEWLIGDRFTAADLGLSE
ncbi:hypothetical protein LCGC14_2042690, partial [marine sediment metagenome]